MRIIKTCVISIMLCLLSHFLSAMEDNRYLKKQSQYLLNNNNNNNDSARADSPNQLKKTTDSYIRAIAFKNDSQEIAACYDNQVTLQEIASNDRITIPIDHKGICSDNSVMYSPNNKELLFNYGGKLMLLDISKKTTTLPNTQVDFVNAAAYLDDDNLIFSSNVNQLEILTLSTNQKRPFYRHCNIVNFDYNKPHNKLVAEAFDDNDGLHTILKVWKSLDRDPVSIACPDYPVFHVNFNSDATCFVTAANSNDKGIIRLWDLAKEKYIHSFYIAEPINNCAYCPDDKQFASTLYRGKDITLWDPKQAKPVGELPVGSFIDRNCLSYSPNSLLLAVGYKDVIKIYDMRMISKILAAVKTMTYKDLNTELQQNSSAD